MSDQNLQLHNYKEFRCPKPGLCLELKPLVDQHDESIGELYDRAGELARKVSDIQVKDGERGKVIGWIVAIGISLLGVSIVNLGVLLIWIGSANVQLQYLKESDGKQSDLLYKIEHQTKQ